MTIPFWLGCFLIFCGAASLLIAIPFGIFILWQEYDTWRYNREARAEAALVTRTPHDSDDAA